MTEHEPCNWCEKSPAAWESDPTPTHDEVAREQALVAEFAREIDFRLVDVVGEWSA